jgi:hypothetical protein
MSKKSPVVFTVVRPLGLSILAKKVPQSSGVRQSLSRYTCTRFLHGVFNIVLASFNRISEITEIKFKFP